MNLKNIEVFQFKNHALGHYDLENSLICIHGANGKGKTNLLDAIYTLIYGKSYLGVKDASLVSNGKSGMRIQGTFDNGITAKLILRETGKKEIYHNDSPVKLMTEHIGRFAAIFIGPDDIQLINDSSEVRRKYLDATISQTDRQYLESLVTYTKILAQRNALLKKWNEASSHERELLDFFDQQMSDHADLIHEARKKSCAELLKSAGQIYQSIATDSQPLQLTYKSGLFYDNLKNLLKENLNKDIASGRTNYGIHKDDLELNFSDESSIRAIGSQGEKKTMLFALKLAQFRYVKNRIGSSPLLLLDDVFEKLDAGRSHGLLDFVKNEGEQIFITDTHFDRLKITFPSAQFIGL